MKRVIITPEYLVNTFSSLPLITFIHAIGPFCLPFEQALDMFDRMIAHFRAEPDEPGKEKAIEAFEEVRQAYLKLSIFERESLYKGLPKAIAEYLCKQKKGITENE